MKKEKGKQTEVILHRNRQHSPEVEQLMQGRLPFVTRHGITWVIVILVVACSLVLLTEGDSQRLMKQMIDHTVEQIKAKL